MAVVTHNQQKKVAEQNKDAMVVVDDQSFIPTIAASELPSKFLPYPEGGLVKYRSYLFGEVKKFNQSIMSRKEELENVLSGIETSFDKLTLTLSDVLYIGLLRKLATFGTGTTTVTYRCKDCGASMSFQMNNEELEFEDINIPKLPVIVSFDKKNAEGVVEGTEDFAFSPLTVGDLFYIIDNNLEEDQINVLARMCRSHDFEVALKRINNASFDEGEALEELDKILYHGIKPIKNKCKECSFITNVEIDGGEAIIRPFRDGGKSLTSRIRFGS
jgi:hypothetical protein